ncbi:MAG: hypothetical protein HeimC2_27660 [Candidatus Heimdallarchaeota archaeon LC_2]|nr:MAG: hypothetical protein HeimC2_27660 [Candidatus Heimdallarchaeota archaeon LC_2]
MIKKDFMSGASSAIINILRELRERIPDFSIDDRKYGGRYGELNKGPEIATEIIRILRSSDRKTAPGIKRCVSCLLKPGLSLNLSKGEIDDYRKTCVNCNGYVNCGFLEINDSIMCFRCFGERIDISFEFLKEKFNGSIDETLVQDRLISVLELSIQTSFNFHISALEELMCGVYGVCSTDTNQCPHEIIGPSSFEGSEFEKAFTNYFNSKRKNTDRLKLYNETDKIIEVLRSEMPILEDDYDMDWDGEEFYWFIGRNVNAKADYIETLDFQRIVPIQGKYVLIDQSFTVDN